MNINSLENKLFKLLRSIFNDSSLILAVLSNPKDKSPSHPQKVTIRPLEIRKQLLYQISFHFADKINHQNYSSEECLDYLSKNIAVNYKHANLFTRDADLQLLTSKKGKTTILSNPPTKSEARTDHNRKKNYILSEGSPVPFLVESGIMSPSGKILDKKRDKFRQINRFLELVEDALSQLNPRKSWHIVDFGCGKAYLTFALYHFLHIHKGYEVDMLGLDLKADVIEQCQNLACKLNYNRLNFQIGDINDHQPAGKVDVVISLHACDTATDAALEKGIRWQADAILSVPCCQHELYSQVSNATLEPMLKHGILKERFAALATDAARSQLLEILGYHSQILEFIDLEHTPKNLLIRAIRQKSISNREDLFRKYAEFKKSLNIDPSLERRFEHELSEFTKSL